MVRLGVSESDTCRQAVVGGHLDVIVWARANGCDWDSGTYTSAKRSRNLAIIKWCELNGCPKV